MQVLYRRGDVTMPEITLLFAEWYIPVLVVHVTAVTISFIGTILWVTSFCQGGVGLKVATVFLQLIASKLKRTQTVDYNLRLTHT